MRLILSAVLALFSAAASAGIVELPHADSAPHLFHAQPSSFDPKSRVAAREMVTILMGRSLGRMKYADGSRDDLLCEVAKEMTADGVKR